MNLGHSVEDLVEDLCARSFFADFTVRSPKYYKLSGQQKEAADLLVVFGGTLLAIQVKSRGVDPENITPVESKRVTKTIDKTTRQFRALAEAMNSPGFKSFVNGRGVDIPFDKKKITDFVLIVVFAPVWKGDSKRLVPVRFGRTCLADGEIPVHLFTLAQFSLLLTLLDTLPDFLLYLDARWALHRGKIIAEGADPIDEWAFTTFERRRVVEVLEKRSFIDVSGLMRRHSISVERLERREKPSYFIDQLIEQLYACVGSTIAVDPRFTLLADPNSLAAYRLIIPYLAKLKRSERCLLVEFLLSRVKKCRNRRFSLRGVKFDEAADEGYVLLASKDERELRQVTFCNVAKGFGYKLHARTVVGLVVGHDWPQSAICDLMLVDLSRMEADENLTMLLKEAFGKTRAVDI